MTKAKKKTTGDSDLASELEKLRKENELLKTQLESRKTPLRDRKLNESFTGKKKVTPVVKATSGLANVSREQELLDAIERIKDKLKSSVKKTVQEDTT